MVQTYEMMKENDSILDNLKNLGHNNHVQNNVHVMNPIERCDE